MGRMRRADRRRSAASCAACRRSQRSQRARADARARPGRRAPRPHPGGAARLPGEPGQSRPARERCRPPPNSQYGVTGTPTFVINGRVVNDTNVWAGIEPLLRGRLSEQDGGWNDKVQVKRLKLSGFKSFVEPAELRIEHGPDRHRRPERLRQIQRARGDPLGDGRKLAQVDARRRHGRRHLRRHRARARRATSPKSRCWSSARRGDAGGDVAIAPSARSRSPAGSSAAPARPIGSTAATSARRTSPCCSPTPRPARIRPALVSQGKISAVIAAKPTERRLMLEEAAGIAGLHVRRKDAEQKLRATEANLIRLDEILADMELRGARAEAAGARRRALPQALRPDPDRRGAADLRPLARGGRGRRGRAKPRPRRPRRRSRGAAEAQRAAAAWQTEAAPALADKRKAAEAARERASALGHQLAALRAERDGVRRRIAELDERRRTLAADRAREEALRRGRRRRDRPARGGAGGDRRPARRGGEPAAARSTSAPSSMRTRPAPPRPRSARPAPSRPPSRPRRGSPQAALDAAAPEARPRRGRGAADRRADGRTRRRCGARRARSQAARAKREQAEAALGRPARRSPPPKPSASRPPPRATPPRARPPRPAPRSPRSSPRRRR